MTRSQFEHVVRASAAILGIDDVLVIGSQALHGSIEGDLPAEAERSIEVDIAVPGDVSGEKGDLIDGSIGEMSLFHDVFGDYARGVGEPTAALPHGWRDRLVRFESPATNGVVAWCLEPHDLWVSKAIADRPRDREFCAALLDAGFVDPDELESRLDRVEGSKDEVREIVRRRIRHP